MLVRANHAVILTFIQACSLAMAQLFLGLSFASKFITVPKVFHKRSSKLIAQVEATDAYQLSFET